MSQNDSAQEDTLQDAHMLVRQTNLQQLLDLLQQSDEENELFLRRGQKMSVELKREVVEVRLRESERGEALSAAAARVRQEIARLQSSFEMLSGQADREKALLEAAKVMPQHQFYGSGNFSLAEQLRARRQQISRELSSSIPLIGAVHKDNVSQYQFSKYFQQEFNFSNGKQSSQDREANEEENNFMLTPDASPFKTNTSRADQPVYSTNRKSNALSSHQFLRTSGDQPVQIKSQILGQELFDNE